MALIGGARKEAGRWSAEVESDETILESPGDRLVMLKLS
jgi:hypothetical protein